MSYNPIYSSDLFKDDGAIQALIKQIIELDNTMSIIDKQVAKFNRQAQKTQATIRKLNATQVEHQEVLEDEVGAVAELSKIQVKAKAAQDKLNASMTEAAIQLAFYKEEQRKVNQINKLTAKLNRSAEGSYNALSAQYSLNKIELNQMGEAQRRNTEEGQRLEQQTREIYEEMKRLQEATGKFSLNVGNYENSVRKVIQEQNKLYKELEQTREEFDSLPKSMKRNAKVAKEYQMTIAGIEAELEGMSMQTGRTVKDLDKAAKETGNLNDELEELPGAAGRGIGGLRGLGRQFKVLARNPVIATIAVIVSALAGLGAAFTRSEKGAQLLAKATGFLQGIMSAIVGIAVNVAEKIEYAFKNPQAALKQIGTSIGNNLLNRLRAVVDFAGVVGDALTAAFKLDTEGLQKAAKDGLTAIRQFTSGLGEQEQKQFANAVKDTVVEIQNEANAFAKLYAEKREIAKQNREIARSLEDAATAEAKYRSIADDITRSFAEREAAAERARQATEVRAAQEIAIAKNNLQAINAEIDLRRQNGENIEALLDQQLESYSQLRQAEREYTLSVQENERTRDELKQDRLERDLDILIDGFDNQKTINERLIADEELTIKKRRDILDDTRKLADDSFREQIKTIQEFTGVQVEANELIQESDAVVLNQKIRSLGLSEIIEGRLLEIVRDRKSAIQDLSDAERDLVDSQIKQAENEKLTFEQRAIVLDEAGVNVEQLYQREIEAASGKENELQLIEVAEQRRLSRLQKIAEQRVKIREDEAEASKEAIEAQIEAIDQELEVQESSIEASANNERKKQIAIRQVTIEAYEKRIQLLEQLGDAESQAQAQILRNQIKVLKGEIESLQGQSSFNIYDLLGFDLSDEQQSALTSSLDYAKQQLLQYAQFRQQIANQNVQAARDEVAEAQRALDIEIQNRNAGFAHQVATREKELAEAKKAQKEALEEQRRAQKEQQAINALQQASNLITASSKVYQQFGFPAAIPVLALMWGSFIAAQTRAAQLTKRQFGKGGYEVIGGGTHADGNDTYAGFEVDGQPAYVERGEGVAIIRANKQRKYGKLVKRMVEVANNDRLSPARIEAVSKAIEGESARQINAYVSGSTRELQPLIMESTYTTDMSRVERLLTDIKRQNDEIYDARGRLVKRGNVSYVYTS